MATNTGFIDLMSFARGQELGNQMNWRDVLNDISSRQQEQNMQIQADAWATRLPLEQQRAQAELDAGQARREAGMAHAELYQRVNALPPEQRTQALIEGINQRMRSLDPNTPAGAEQIIAANNHLVNTASRIAATDPEGAKQLLAQAVALNNPLAAQEQQRAYNQQQLQMLQERFGPQYFVADPRTGAPINMIPMMTAVEQYQRQYGQPGVVPTQSSLAPNETVDTPSVATTPAPRPAAMPTVATTSAPQMQPTAAAPYSNVRWTDIINPWRVPNAQLRADVRNWMPQWLTAPTQQPAQQVPFGSFNVFGGGFR